MLIYRDDLSSCCILESIIYQIFYSLWVLKLLKSNDVFLWYRKMIKNRAQKIYTKYISSGKANKLISRTINLNSHLWHFLEKIKRSREILITNLFKKDDKWSGTSRDLLISSLRRIPVVHVARQDASIVIDGGMVQGSAGHLQEIYVYIMNSMYLCILYTISRGAIVNSVRLWTTMAQENSTRDVGGMVRRGRLTMSFLRVRWLQIALNGN